MFEDSILYSQKNLMLKYENEKKLSMIDESKKRDTIIYVFSTILILIIACYCIWCNVKKSPSDKRQPHQNTTGANESTFLFFNALNW